MQSYTREGEAVLNCTVDMYREVKIIFIAFSVCWSAEPSPRQIRPSYQQLYRPSVWSPMATTPDSLILDRAFD